MTLNAPPRLLESARRLFPDLEFDEVFAQLLLERAQRALIRYQTQARAFQTKYGQDFDAFRLSVMTTDSPFEREQDYFDWELAMTGIDDMKAEIDQLQQYLELE